MDHQLTSLSLAALQDLLNFGERCLRHQNLDISRLMGCKKIYFPMFIKAHSYGMAIATLCAQDQPAACADLLRSLCENLINAKFLFCNKRKHSHVIYLDNLIEKEKQFRKALQFLKEHPTYDPGSVLSVKTLQKSLDKTLKLKEIVKKQIGSTETTLDTMGRAHLVDKYCAQRALKSDFLEWHYIVLFCTLSASVHSKIYLILDEYFERRGREVLVYFGGDPKNIEKVIALTEFWYKDFLDSFLKIFKSSFRKEFKKYKRTPLP